MEQKEKYNMEQKEKAFFIMSEVLICIAFVVEVCIVSQLPPLWKFISAFGLSGIQTGWVILLAKRMNSIPYVFDPEKYFYYPEAKEKLSIKATLYYMQDIMLANVLLGTALGTWAVALIIVEVIVVVEKVILKEVLIAHACLIVALIFILGMYFLFLFAVKSTDMTKELVKNTIKYVDISKKEFLDSLQQDLEKGMFFRSKSPCLTTEYLIGNMSYFSLAPIAIPRAEIQKIRYRIEYYQKYTKAEFAMELRNGKKAVIYAKYVNPRDAVSMFNCYGFDMVNESGTERS